MMETGTQHESTPDFSNMQEPGLGTEDSLDFSSPWCFSDVVLVVEDTKLHVHKSTLSIWSPVFRAMFTSNFLESTAKEVPLPGKQADEMKVLLKVIYSSGTTQKITEENHEFLLELAQEYQMDKVKEFCVEYLASNITEQNCLQRYKVAECFQLKNILKECNGEACFKSSANLQNSEEFNNLKFESKFKICMARVKELEKTLEKYVTTCSELVNSYYKEVFKNVTKGKVCDNQDSHTNIDENQTSHLPTFSTFGYERAAVVSRSLDLTCKFCMKRVQDAESQISNKSFIEQFKILYNLKFYSRVNKQVAEEAKE